MSTQKTLNQRRLGTLPNWVPDSLPNVSPMTTTSTTSRLWLATLCALVMALILAMPAAAAEPDGPFAGPRWGQDAGRTWLMRASQQFYNDDLTVERGQVIEGDVMVYSGNVEVENGGRITGDLVVYSGNIELEEGSTVDGDVTSFTGNVAVAGHVGGDMFAWNGDVELEASATVNGDISVVSGSIRRDDGATVHGDVVQGPSFRFPRGGNRNVPEAPDGPPGISFRARSNGLVGGVLNFIGRLIAAALMTALAMLLVGVLYYARPQLIADTRKQLEEQLALSAVVGGLANLTALFLVGLLAITLCLLPLALVPMLLLLAVNVVGWAVISQIVGEKIVAFAKQEVQPVLTLLVGAFFLTGILALLWALPGCFRFVAWLLTFAIGSVGSGAVLLPWINRRRGFGGMGGGSDEEDGDNGGDGGDGPTVPPTPSGPYGTEVETDVAAPLDYVTAEEVNAGRSAAASRTQRSAETSTSSADIADREVVERDVAQPLDYMTAEEINATQQSEPKAARQSRSSGGQTTPESSTSSARRKDEPVEQVVAQPLDYVTAEEVNTTEVVGEGDDFLQIRGIGPTYARRLKEAGFATYAQLAAATPEEVAQAIGWPPDRVRRSELIDQAKVLANK